VGIVTRFAAKQKKGADPGACAGPYRPRKLSV
jgi:hypothetical protein